jgi:hypothetical protein
LQRFHCRHCWCPNSLCINMCAPLFKHHFGMYVVLPDAWQMCH